MASSKVLTFRVQHIPSYFTKDDLTQSIRNVCDETEQIQLEIIADLVPSISNSVPEQIAIVNFLPQPPRFLQNILQSRSGVREEQIRVSSPRMESLILSFDLNFFGLTQVFQPTDGEISMDIVAVTGLDGNAFGSWKSRQTSKMWLRDFLREDLPSCRVLIYGYNLKLASNMLHTFQDLCDQFLESMKVARASEEVRYRPLVLIGHSYGSRIITKSLVRCKILDHDPVLSAFLSATQAVVFFGGPHRGMITKDIENYLADQFPDHIARQKIVAELRQDDESTKRELQDFIDLVGPFFIISIYERKPSRTLVPQESEGQVRKWDRVGQEYVPVVENSAVLNLPSRFEIRIPIDSDHSNMAKFDHKDLTYQALLGYLKEIEQISSPAAYPWTNLLNSGRRRLPSHDKVEEAESDIVDQKALINVAIKIVRSYRTSVLRVLDQNVADQASLLLSIEVALLGARNYLSLLQSSSRGGKTVARAIVMEYCETMNNLIVLLDVLSTHTVNSTSYPRQPHLPRQQLPQILQRLERLQQKTSRILSSEISQLYHSLGSASALPNEASKKISTLANMSITQFDLDNLSHLDPQWVPYTDLYFATGATSETDREEKNWLERLVATFTQFNAQNLKLQPRRFGAFNYENQLRKVMVEFRPYLPKLWETRPTEYDRQKWQVIKLGRMLRAATASDAAASFPCVPLLFLSECRTSSPPTFVLIYAAENLYSLDEAVRFSPPPSPQQRLRLALRLTRSIAALHLAGIVHGVINPENIYLRYDPGLHARSDPFNMSIDEAMATLAGFDIARDFAGRSSKLDVEDADLRVYLHPERMGWGGEKEMQHPRYDVFSLGLVMIEIGLWKRFKMLQKYQNADTDEERKEFSMQLRGHFKGNSSDGHMDERYRAIVSYCLGRRADPIIQEDDLEMGLHSASVLPLGIPNAVRVVQALIKILGESESS